MLRDERLLVRDPSRERRLLGLGVRQLVAADRARGGRRRGDHAEQERDHEEGVEESPTVARAGLREVLRAGRWLNERASSSLAEARRPTRCPRLGRGRPVHPPDLAPPRRARPRRPEPAFGARVPANRNDAVTIRLVPGRTSPRRGSGSDEPQPGPRSRSRCRSSCPSRSDPHRSQPLRARRALRRSFISRAQSAPSGRAIGRPGRFAR